MIKLKNFNFLTKIKLPSAVRSATFKGLDLDERTLSLLNFSFEK